MTTITTKKKNPPTKILILRRLGKLFFELRGIMPIPFLIIAFSTADSSSHVGLAFIGLGECLRFWAAGHIGVGSRRTRNAAADRLVCSGPYAWTRNPLYVGNISIYFGFAVLSNVLFPAFPGIVVITYVVIYGVIVRYEEGFLELRFGPEYHDYCNRVSRWIPTRFAGRTDRRFEFSKALRSEMWTLAALAAVGGLLWLRKSQLMTW